MRRTTVTRQIGAPRDRVFEVVADVRRFSQALPHVVRYEFLSELQSGVGTRFRETRLMNGREATTELEVTEHVQNDRIRLLADDHHGTVWDTLFTVVDADDGSTILTMTMDARSKTWIARIMVFLVAGMVRKAVERDMDGVKAFCEGAVADSARPG